MNSKAIFAVMNTITEVMDYNPERALIFSGLIFTTA